MAHFLNHVRGASNPPKVPCTSAPPNKTAKSKQGETSMTRAMAARSGTRSSPNCKVRAFQNQQQRVGNVFSCFAGYVGSALDGNKKRKGKSGRTQGWQPAPPQAGTYS